MIEIIIKWAIPFLLTALCGYIVKELKDAKKSNHAIQSSMIILLRSQIVGKCEDYLNLGYLPDYARLCLEDLFEQYKILGGNHGVGVLVDKTFNLPPEKRGLNNEK